MCCAYQKSKNVLFSSTRRVQPMLRTRKRRTLLMMFCVRNLVFALMFFAMPSALFFDLFDVK